MPNESQLHPNFEEIIKNALFHQWEREKNKVVKPRQWHPEVYMEIHESREELEYDYRDYEGGRF